MWCLVWLISCMKAVWPDARWKTFFTNRLVISTLKKYWTFCKYLTKTFSPCRYRAWRPLCSDASVARAVLAGSAPSSSICLTVCLAIWPNSEIAMVSNYADLTVLEILGDGPHPDCYFWKYMFNVSFSPQMYRNFSHLPSSNLQKSRLEPTIADLTKLEAWSWSRWSRSDCWFCTNLIKILPT